jgi:hypothetical protein
MEDRREPEVWKPIPDYEGIYEVSSWGRVKGLSRMVGHRVKGFLKKNPEKILTNHIRGTYEFVNLYKNNLRNPQNINVLVAKVFLKDYKESLLVNHKDKNKLNNYYKNLEMVSSRENVTFSVNKNTTSSNYVGAYVSYKTVNGKSYKQIHSEISILGKKIWLGSFKTEEAAHEAYLKALEVHGLTNKYAKKNQE